MKPRPFSGMAKALHKAAKGLSVFDPEIVYASKLKKAKLVGKAIVKGRPVYTLNKEGRKVLKLLKKDSSVLMTVKRW